MEIFVDLSEVNTFFPTYRFIIASISMFTTDIAPPGQAAYCPKTCHLIILKILFFMCAFIFNLFYNNGTFFKLFLIILVL